MNTEGIKETTFRVHDLCCATEEAAIRKRLGAQPGIFDLEFNAVSHRLRVKHSCDDEVILRHLKAIGLPGVRESSFASAPRYGPHRRLMISTIASAFFFAAAAVVSLSETPETPSTLLFIAAIVSGGWHIALKALQALRNRSLDMNFLMAIASVGAVAIGEHAEAAAVILLFALSLLLESMSIERSRRAIHSLMKLSPTTAAVLRSGRETTVPVEEINPGETIIIRPGERIGMDGEVTAGSSTVDQAPITGESIPVAKRAGDQVYAGSFNQRGSLEVRVTRLATDSVIARIIHLVEEAQSKKAPSQTFTERFARIYTPAVFVLAIGVAALPPLLFAASFEEWFYRALVLLVIACPCALVISTPLTLVSALTNAARHGILVKGGKHLEKLAGVRAVAFDKTGTLTIGRPAITDILSLDSISPREILRITAAAELKSEHHLADAFLRKAEEEGIALSDVRVDAFHSLTGRGVRATVDGKTYIVGNHQLVEELGVCSPAVEQALDELEAQGKTVVILSDEERVLGVIAVADRLRHEGSSTVEELHGVGVDHVVLLTGDNRGTALKAAEALKVDDVRAELLPEQKLNAVHELKLLYGSVAMVGDGVNDAPALAAADVGIAMGGIGSDTALETADVVLMSDNISKVPFGISLGRRTLTVIKQNIVLSLLTKAVFLLLGIFGWTSLWLAILADDGAALLVIMNGLRLLKHK